MNCQFQSVFTSDSSELPPIEGRGIPSLPPLVINEHSVYKILTGLKDHKASGPDGVSARVLKQCTHSIAPALQQIFHASVNTKNLPSHWRIENVTPLFKAGRRSLPSNYRPMSLTSISCKIIEHIVSREPPSPLPNFPVPSSYKNGNCLNIRTSLDILDNIHPRK